MGVGVRLRTAFVLLGMLLLTTLHARRSVARSALDLTEIDRFIVEQMRAQRIPGLALAITQGDQVLLAKGYGTARADQPVTPQTQFRIASLSKSFTAVAVLQLVEAGKLDLDAPVQRYLPTFTLADPAVAARITLRQLLHHAGGLGDAGYPEMRLPPPATLEERVANLAAARPIASPGAEFHYMDANYGVLARVVEVVSEQPFSDYLQQYVFAPLQMAHTFNVITPQEAAPRAEQLAQGHLLAFAIPVASPEERGILGGSGGVVSTAQDMAHYLVMHSNEGRFQGVSLLTPDSVALLHTPPATLDSHYAMGWLEAPINGTPALQHNGILSTFYSEMVLLPESGHGVVILYNVQSQMQDALGFPLIKNGLVALLTGEQAQAGGVSVLLAGIALALLLLLSVALQVRALLRLPQWVQQAPTRPRRRLWVGIGWAFVPAVLVLGMPKLVLATSGRAFGYITLFRAMLDVMIWLALSAVLGTLIGVARLIGLARRRRDARSHPA